MSDSQPPENKSLLFTFGDDGYMSPDFSSRDMDYEGVVSDLKMMITGAELQRDYLKSCKTTVLGYNQEAVQILRYDCVYGGIRDLAAQIEADFIVKDLMLYVKGMLPSHKDLGFILKGSSTVYNDLRNSIQGWSLGNVVDLPTYAKQGWASTADFSAYAKTCYPDFKEISALVKGWAIEESALLGAILKGFDTAQRQFPAYIKPTIPEEVDLNLDVFKIWQHNSADLPTVFAGWAALDLNEIIRGFVYYDLPSQIRATYLADLASVMVAVPPLDLTMNLHGWAVTDMPTSIAYAQGPGDLFANITGVTPKDLSVFISAWLGIEVSKDLQLFVQSYYTVDLRGVVSTIEAMDLPAILIPKGASVNLAAHIYPKVVYVRTVLSLSYLECIDLAASVNPYCFNTAYANLAARLYSMHSNNLKASIFGTDGSNIINLSAFINSYAYYEENILSLSIFKQPLKYTSMVLKTGDFDSYTEIDTLPLSLYGAYDPLYSFGNNLQYLGTTGTDVAKSVWDSNYAAVYHLSQDPSGGAGAILDSTVNEYNGTAVNMSSDNLVLDTYGYALTFDGTSEYIKCGAGLLSKFSTGTPIYFSCRFKVTGTLSSEIYNNILFAVNSDSGGNRLRIGITNTGAVFLGTEDDFFNNAPDATFGSGMADGDFHTVALFVDSVGNRTLWIDEDSPIYSASTIQIGWDTSASVSLGQEWDTATATDFFPGIIDEVQISNISRPEASIKSLNDSLFLIEWGESTNELKLTIDSDLIDEDLTDFVAMLRLGTNSGTNLFDTSNIFEVLGDNNLKFRIETSFGEPCLAEIGDWDSDNKLGTVWIKIPTVSSSEDTVLYLTYASLLKFEGTDELYATITGKFVEVDLPAFLRAYTPISYEASALKEKFITLKLDHSNFEEWRRYVELTFESYVRSYYYFSGNKKAYPEFKDDHWVVQVKGYSLANLPEGVERTKLNRKYIFNLKRYSSVDEAIKDMTDRVTALKGADLGCFITGDAKREANLTMTISSSIKDYHKSNRNLTAKLNAFEDVTTRSGEVILSRDDDDVVAY
jgi:hypothetical protein